MYDKETNPEWPKGSTQWPYGQGTAAYREKRKVEYAKRLIPDTPAYIPEGITKATAAAEEAMENQEASHWDKVVSDAAKLRVLRNKLKMKGPLPTLDAAEALDEVDKHFDAPDFLAEALYTITDRAESRDQDDERSMLAATNMMNAYRGDGYMSELDGWVFMVFLKLSRSSKGEYNRDDWLDAVAYMALAAETADRQDEEEIPF